MRQRNVLLVLALAASLVNTAPSGDAAQQPAPPSPPVTITLISGDKVTVRGMSAAVTPGPGRERVLFHRRVEEGHVHVIPDDALPLLAENRLDVGLFDVTGLIAQGYDDERADSIPLLRTSDGVSATAVVKKDASASWHGLRATAGPRARPGKLWLDAKVRVSLDESVPMTNAPSAWADGVRGDGVQVAVLDTGVDATHPELSGAIAQTRGFTDAGPADVVDRNGHGTHVASTIAGRGERYRGVAPRASLMIGKVVDDNGNGRMSWIIAGMEWAARSGARVINMSLGTDFETDGTDPLSQAVNSLTAETGALFVVAAGNRAGLTSAIGAPGAADSALTIGSVDKDGVLSGFSRVGPRFGDKAVKPDLTAPGGAIVAARAAGTLADEAVDESHARLSGTSMATPHAAGVAALTAQRHPEWDAAELKAYLMGTALPAADVYAHGAGRVQAANTALRTDVGSVSFGKFSEPQTVSREVTYFNDGSAPITLALATDLPGASVSPNTIEVPAGGSTSTTVSVAPLDGTQGGALTSTQPDGSAGPRVILGVTVETTHALTIKTLRRDGAPAPLPNLVLTNGDMVEWPVVGPEGATLEVPPGTYSVYGTMPERTEDFETTSVITFARGRIQVDADTEVVIDGRQSRPVTVALSGDSLARVAGRGDSVGVPGGAGVQSGGRAALPFYGMSRDADGIQFQSHTIAARPQLVLTSGTFTPDVDYAFGSPRFSADASLPVTTGPDVRGKLVAIRETDNAAARVRRAADAGAVGVVFPRSRFGVFAGDAPIPVLEADSFDRLAESTRVSVRIFSGSPYSYNLAFNERSVPNGKTYSVSESDLVRVDVDYRSAGVSSAGTVVALPSTDYLVFADATGIPVDFPQRRAEYYTPGRWTRYSAFAPDHGGKQVSPEFTLEAGRSYRHTWLPAVFAPDEPIVTRDGATVLAQLDVFSTGVSADLGDIDTDHGSLTLKRGGTVFGRSEMPSFGFFENVTPGPLELELVATRSAPWWGLSTQVTSNWKFETVPLTVRYHVPTNEIDDDGTFDLSFSRDARSVKVWSSADDGVSWTALRTEQIDSRWRVRLPGTTGEHVSLKVAAVGVDGDAVEQTVIRALALR